MRSCRSPRARSASTSYTSVVQPSASTARREISSALPRLAASARTPPRRHRGEQGARGVRCSGTTAAGPRQECLHGLDQSGRVLPGKHRLHAAGRPHRATPRSRHVRPRSAPRRSHAAPTPPHARPRCDAPPPAAAPTADPAAVHTMRGAHHLVVAAPVLVPVGFQNVAHAADQRRPAPLHRPDMIVAVSLRLLDLISQHMI